jgi:hypothetical protein
MCRRERTNTHDFSCIERLSKHCGDTFDHAVIRIQRCTPSAISYAQKQNTPLRTKSSNTLIALFAAGLHYLGVIAHREIIEGTRTLLLPFRHDCVNHYARFVRRVSLGKRNCSQTYESMVMQKVDAVYMFASKLYIL